MSGQNAGSTSACVRRVEPPGGLDDCPTPPWATRALIRHVIGPSAWLKGKEVLEPACGRGHMARALGEYFGSVTASDIQDYGFTPCLDFLEPYSPPNYPPATFDWVITNPPFRLAEAFIEKALQIARDGVAMLVRTQFLEGVGRHERLFSVVPPEIVAPFVERVPMVKGRLDRKAASATSYTWMVWGKYRLSAPVPPPTPKLIWIPPCRKTLERDSDYSIYSPDTLNQE